MQCQKLTVLCRLFFCSLTFVCPFSLPQSHLYFVIFLNVTFTLPTPVVPVIEEANWLSLSDDLTHMEGVPKGGFDAVLCLGNSFSHLPDFEGGLLNQKVALTNFWSMIKPGGILLIDHRNFDDVLANGWAPAKNIYYVVRIEPGFIYLIFKVYN